MKKELKVKYVDVKLDNNFELDSPMQSRGKDIILETLSKKYEVKFSDDPDIIFSWYPVCGLKGTDYYKYNCKKCLWLLESEVPDFNCFDYVISPYHNLKYYDKHLYLPASIMVGNNIETELNYKLAQEKHKKIDADFAKRKICSFTVSNNTDADSERVDFFKMLCEYKTVDSGGRIYNNIGGRVKNKLEFDSAHKFSIAFENMRGSFITEKLDAAFAGKTIPIYWGNPYVTEVYNPKAFINCHDNKSVDIIKDELTKFISMAVEDSKKLRSCNCINKRAELVKFLGREAYWKRQKRKERIMKTLAFLFKPWTHSKFGQYIKGIIIKK